MGHEHLSLPVVAGLHEEGCGVGEDAGLVAEGLEKGLHLRGAAELLRHRLHHSDELSAQPFGLRRGRPGSIHPGEGGLEGGTGGWKAGERDPGEALHEHLSHMAL